MRVKREASTSTVLTIPNALSFARILLIPVFVGLIVHRGTEAAGLLVFALVAATDWVDGYLARRTGAVSDLGKVLDPTADRLAIAAGLVAVVVRGAFPLWAALLILVRDGAILVAAMALLATRRQSVEVRFLGKAATFALMIAVPSVAWGSLGLWLAPTALAVGWVTYAVGIVEYYLAAVLYAGDLRAAFAGTRSEG